MAAFFMPGVSAYRDQTVPFRETASPGVLRNAWIFNVGRTFAVTCFTPLQSQFSWASPIKMLKKCFRLVI